MLYLVEQYKLYILPFSVSCAIHYGVFQYGIGGGSSSTTTDPLIMFRSGNSGLELTIMPSAPSRAAIAATKAAQKTDVKKQRNNVNNSSSEHLLTQPPIKPAVHREESRKIGSVSKKTIPAHTELDTRAVRQPSSALSQQEEKLKSAQKTDQKEERKPEKAMQEEKKSLKAGKPLSNEDSDKRNSSSTINSINSLEQDGDLRRKGVISDGHLSGVLYPHYPRSCRRNGEEGTVVLSIIVGSDGSVKKVSVMESSGYVKLDKAAVETVYSARFTPGTKNGIPRKSSMTLSITYSLKDSDR